MLYSNMLDPGSLISLTLSNPIAGHGGRTLQFRGSDDYFYLRQLHMSDRNELRKASKQDCAWGYPESPNAFIKEYTLHVTRVSYRI